MDLTWASATVSSLVSLKRTTVLSLSVFLCLLFSIQADAAVYMTTPEFIDNSLGDSSVVKSVWIRDDENQVAKKILGHSYPGLRVRYWQHGSKTAWVMDEVGKDRPITIGVVVSEGKIEKVSILAFRESRGGEVRHPFFTRQFVDMFLRDNMKLDRKIDGIAGATLSVRAVSRVSRYALYLHSLVVE